MDMQVRNVDGWLISNATADDPLMYVHRNPMPTATGNSSNSEFECEYFGCYYYNRDVYYTFETVTCTFGKPSKLLFLNTESYQTFEIESDYRP